MGELIYQLDQKFVKKKQKVRERNDFTFSLCSLRRCPEILFIIYRLLVKCSHPLIKHPKQFH